jgi:hypothetical protein
VQPTNHTVPHFSNRIQVKLLASERSIKAGTIHTCTHTLPSQTARDVKKWEKSQCEQPITPLTHIQQRYLSNVTYDAY